MRKHNVAIESKTVSYTHLDVYKRQALEYVDWRTAFKKKSGKSVGRNTAIMELKLFAMIMGEAVRLGHAAVSYTHLPDTARQMLIHAFAGEIINRVKCEAAREELDKVIWDRLEANPHLPGK